ncbi:MAG: hypothetical protein LHV69_02930 [Elusimicrobia bacterium]|nr:hypothetical protein [Candidatus Obscuribacterium magneticum]
MTIFFSFPSLSLADRRPPGTMQGEDREIPAHVMASAGGVVSSSLHAGDAGHIMSVTLGEAFSGRVRADDCLDPDAPCNVEFGYGVFEFYSDRIPIYDLQLTINGGRPITNRRDVTVGVTYRDDLAGLKEAVVRERWSGVERNLSLSAEDFFSLRLGSDGTPPDQNIDGEYFLDFEFTDRAGNISVPPIPRAIILDTVAPEGCSVLLNRGEKYTNSSTVTVTLSCHDAPPFPTGVENVRLSTTTDMERDGKSYLFNEPETSFRFYLGSEEEGEKTVYALFGDQAGNWSEAPAQDQIIRGRFSPGGSIAFRYDDGRVLVGPDGLPETNVVDVPVVIDWVVEQAGGLAQVTLSRIQCGGGTIVDGFDLPIGIDDINNHPRSDIVYHFAPGTTGDGLYCLQAVFRDYESHDSYPSTATLRLNRDILPTPTVLTPIGVNSSSLTLQAVVGDDTRYIRSISFTPTRGFDVGASSASFTLSYSTETVTFVDVDLRPNSAYSYIVRSHDLFSFSNPAPFPTSFDRGILYTLAADPAFVRTPEAKEVSVIRVTWGANGNPPDTLTLLEYDTDPGFSDPQMEKSGWATSLSREIEGLRVGTPYYFRVRARNNQSPVPVETGFVDLGSTATLSYVQPMPPLLLEAAQITPTTVSWRWIRQPSTEEGYLIRNATGGVVADVPLLVSTPAFTCFETGLIPDTLTPRTIVAYNHLNNQLTLSASTGTVIMTHPAAPLPGSISVRGSDISVEWGPKGNPADTNYNVQMAENDEFTNGLESGGWGRDLNYAFRGLKPQTTYYFQVQSRGRPDDRGIQIYSEMVYLGSAQTKTFDHGNELDISDLYALWRLKLPPNTFGEDFVVQLEVDPSNFTSVSLEALARATQKARQDSNGYRFPIPGGLVEMIVTDAQGESLGTPMQRQGELVHHFADSFPHDQIVDRQSAVPQVHGLSGPLPQIRQLADETKEVRVQTLRMWVFDGDTKSWVKLPNNNLDLTQNEVIGGVPICGIFAVMGAPDLEVSNVIAYPVPWRPFGPMAGVGDGLSGTESQGIRFANIPQEGSIKIFTLEGRLVKEISLSGQLIESWDVRNVDGENVASGTYFWVTEAGEQRKVGKLLVIR